MIAASLRSSQRRGLIRYSLGFLCPQGDCRVATLLATTWFNSLLFGFPISPRRLPPPLPPLLPPPVPYSQALVVARSEATWQSPDYGVLMPEYKSTHCGFIVSTKAFFFFREQDLICFSRSSQRPVSLTGESNP